MKSITFSKADLIQSKRYSKHRDLLVAVLKDGKQYTLKEVDSIIKNVLQKEVK